MNFIQNDEAPLQILDIAAGLHLILLFLVSQSEDEAQVTDHRTEPAVVLHHDVEAFLQRGLVVAGGHALVQVVDECEVGVVDRMGFLQDTDAPVKISRKAVVQVVGLDQGASGKEGLVTHPHALPEALPGQYLGSRQAAHTQEVTFAVHNGCFSVQHIGQVSAVDGMHHPQQGVFLVQFIPCVQEAQVVAGGQADAFVHGVVQAVVGFADHGGDMFAVLLDQGQGTIGRTTIHHDVFQVLVTLGDDTLNGILQHPFGIVGHGDDGELRMGVKIMHGFR